ncbi:MAG TPA: hypothetical protein VJV04_00500 [Nitrospiraceae bacterium]|nr:hypothetical protein [Nitrospiraceae bacterium]
MLHLPRMAPLLSIFLTSILTLAAQAEGAALDSQMKVQGRIVDIESDRIVIDTLTASYTLNKKAAPLRAKIGDQVTLWVTTDHVVIDHHPQATEQRHRFITGTLLNAKSKKQIKLWTPEGNRTYSLEEHEAKTDQLRQGTMVTVEINESGYVIDLHPVEAQVAGCDKRHHCKVMLHGIVLRIEDNMIFIKTPVVEYELPMNIAAPNTAPGDEMTLWVNENNVVLDHYRAGEMSPRRFVTGPVRYADKTRAHIKLWTPEGEKTFSLLQIKTGAELREGNQITLEIDEADRVVVLR